MISSIFAMRHVLRVIWKFLKAGHPIWIFPSPPRFKDPSNTDAESDLVGDASDGRRYVENSQVSKSLLLMKFYSLSSGVVNHFLSDRAGRELDLPFEVTDQEMEIILYQRSTFILGRLGTGKTTVLTKKLFQKEQCFQLADQGCLGSKNSTVEQSSSATLLFLTCITLLFFKFKRRINHLKLLNFCMSTVLHVVEAIQPRKV